MAPVYVCFLRCSMAPGSTYVCFSTVPWHLAPFMRVFALFHVSWLHLCVFFALFHCTWLHGTWLHLCVFMHCAMAPGPIYHVLCCSMAPGFIYVCA